MSIFNIAAIDLGASSGRIMLSRYDSSTKNISLQEIHRFKNKLRKIEGSVCWDLIYIEKQIITGLNKILNSGKSLDSIGIDTWGVDYVLLDKHGEILGYPYSYRDSRTKNIMNQVQKDLGANYIYKKTGIQFLSFNSLYQLKAFVDSKPNYWDQITNFVMIPDYLNFRLTGKLNQEYTNATTTQLININTDSWDDTLLNYLGIPRDWFGQIQHPGQQIGLWNNIPVTSVASHDTASAVIATPLKTLNSAYLCSGTWSLMGIDSLEVYNDHNSLLLNITNEGGIDGHYRVLKNIMGLWLFQRLCDERNINNIENLINQTYATPPFRALINPNHESFLNPISMVKAIQDYCDNSNQFIPQTSAELARCIFDSLAMLYRQTILELGKLRNIPVDYLHIVGGGSQNNLLNQLCADLCQLEVYSGPIEASVLGNIGCQLMALDQIQNISEFRQIVTQNFPLQKFKPNFNFLSTAKLKQLITFFSQLN